MQIKLIARKPTPATSLRVDPALVEVRSRPARVLDFDVECRPLHFYGDFVSKEITAIAWAWVDKPDDVSCVLLGEMDGPEMLRRFVAVYNQADIVTGHFITGFDLPLLAAGLIEYQMPALSDKLVSDTKTHLIKRHGLSGSQENIGAILGLAKPKIGMNQATWRAANRLTPEGLELVRERVVGDVKQHIEMRAKLVELGYISGPKLWRSKSTQPAAAYTP